MPARRRAAEFRLESGIPAPHRSAVRSAPRWSPEAPKNSWLRCRQPRKSDFTTKAGHSFGGEYLEIVPNERIRNTDRFDDPNLPGVIDVTVILKPVSVGTEINIEQSNLPAAIPVEACYLGWQQSLTQLASLVEPEIPE
ncbi:SRPBCC domain-containing protein [Bradyrhizobium sediminis]|uniref:SRPBCC domain-containing protein n=1 Tax=Bradyrhizobium sediminis TaxID=2840469 RepID=A0A975P428_9BRAD|nr:SRPBCC domain-containing protein [Bradyrhizobium sediminis]